jgi:DNA-binding SARP family transcriptional activator
MEIRLLGPVEAVVGDRALDLGPQQRRSVLAALAVDAGRPVAVDALLARIWGEQPPDRARRALHAHLSRLRKVFSAELAAGSAATVIRHSAGYLLDVRPDTVDTHRFHSLVERARDGIGTDRARLRMLREALRLWRGEALMGLSCQWADRVREAWRRQRLDAVVAAAELELRTGPPAALVGELRELTVEYPLAESLAAVLMRALQAGGRSAEALEHYLVVRRRLAEDLGADPGPQLRRAHLAILRGEPVHPGARPRSTRAGTF